MPRETSKCREWEKERRHRLNEAFLVLCKLLPCYDPAINTSKIDILKNAASYIEELQNKIKDLLASDSTESVKKVKGQEIKRLQDRIRKLLSKNEQLCNLLREAKISIPIGCSFIRRPLRWSGHIAPEQAKILQKKELNKENSTTKQKKVANTRSKLNVPKHRKAIINRIEAKRLKKKKNLKNTSMPKCVFILTQPNNITQPYYVITNAPSNLQDNTITVSSENKKPIQNPLGAGTLILANGTILPVLPPPQPILPLTSRIIPINTRSIQNPLILLQKNNAPNLPKIKPKYCYTKTTQINKVPIPALTSRYSNNDLVLNKTKQKQSNKSENKEKIDNKRKSENENDSNKKMKNNEDKNNKQTSELIVENETNKTTNETNKETTVEKSLNDKSDKKEVEKSQEIIQENLELNINHSELSNDIFASLNDVQSGCQNPESTSPTAAFLLAFPLVSTLNGVKVTEVTEEDDNNDDQRQTPTTLLQIGTMDTTKPTQSENLTPNLLNLDNLTFFSSKDFYTNFDNNVTNNKKETGKIDYVEKNLDCHQMNHLNQIDLNQSNMNQIIDNNLNSVDNNKNNSTTNNININRSIVTNKSDKLVNEKINNHTITGNNIISNQTIINSNRNTSQTINNKKNSNANMTNNHIINKTMNQHLVSNHSVSTNRSNNLIHPVINNSNTQSLINNNSSQPIIHNSNQSVMNNSNSQSVLNNSNQSVMNNSNNQLVINNVQMNDNYQKLRHKPSEIKQSCPNYSQELFTNSQYNNFNSNDLKICTCSYVTVTKSYPEPLYTNSNSYYSTYTESNFYPNNITTKNDHRSSYYSLNYENYTDYRKQENPNYYTNSNNNVKFPMKSNKQNLNKQPINWMTDNRTDYLQFPAVATTKEDYTNTFNSQTYFNNTCNESDNRKLDLPLIPPPPPPPPNSYQRNDLEENQFSWSPTKIPQFLDSSHSFVSSTLPTLVGDLALNNSKEIKKGRSVKNYDNNQGNFSISQLVDHNKEIPARTTTRRNSGNRGKSSAKNKRSKDGKNVEKINKQYGHNNEMYCDKNNRISQKNSSYSAEALIGHNMQSDVLNKNKQQQNYTNPTNKLSVSTFLPDLPYFPATVDLQQDNNYMQQNQNYQNFTHFTTFQNNTYTSNTFIPATTTYLNTSNFMHDINTEYTSDMFKEKTCKNQTKCSNTTTTVIATNQKKIQLKRKQNDLPPNFVDFPFLSMPGAINSPILPDDFHTHTSFLQPPTPQLYPCKNPLYTTTATTKHQNDLSGTLLTLPPVPASVNRNIQHSEISPSIQNSNNVGTSLTNFNLSTIFPEINKGALTESYLEPRIKEPTRSYTTSSAQVAFNNKPTFSFSYINGPTSQSYNNQ